MQSMNSVNQLAHDGTRECTCIGT